MSIPIKATAVGRIVIDLQAQGIHYVWPEQGTIVNVADADLPFLLPYFTLFGLLNLTVGPNTADTVGPLVHGQWFDVVTIPVPLGHTVAGVLIYRAEVTDGTENAAEVGIITFSAVNKAGTIIADVSTGNASRVPSDIEVLTLALAPNWYYSATASTVTLTVQPAITGTPTQSAIRYDLNLLSPVELIDNPVGP